jgi:hypothetical protein
VGARSDALSPRRNILITAHDTYYPIDAVPEYWAWLAHHCGAGNIKMPVEIYEEVLDGGNTGTQALLKGWLQEEFIASVLVLDEDVDADLVRRVIDEGYARDLTDLEMEALGRDPFLIAYSLADSENRCVVTAETSKPSKRRQNRKVPDVCESLGVLWHNPFELTRALHFSTDWNRGRRRR